jgi:hypothetical protein
VLGEGNVGGGVRHTLIGVVVVSQQALLEHTLPVEHRLRVRHKGERQTDGHKGERRTARAKTERQRQPGKV